MYLNILFQFILLCPFAMFNFSNIICNNLNNGKALSSMNVGKLIKLNSEMM